MNQWLMNLASKGLPKRFWLLATFGAVLLLGTGQALAAPPIPILLDTDIGEDIDDTFALALVLASPELELRGVTTVGHDAHTRAQMVCRFLAAVGRRTIPVAAGLSPKGAPPLAGWQVQYARHPTVFFRDPKPVKERASDFLYKKLKAQPGQITLVALGPLTNLAQLLTEHPDCKPWIKRIVLMGGSLRRGYRDNSPAEPEYNLRSDPPAAQAVFRSGVPLTVAPLDATAMLELGTPLRQRLFAARSPLTFQVQALYQLWQENNQPILFDPVAVALGFEERFCRLEDLNVEVDAKGFLRQGQGKPNARLATAMRKDEFLRWFVDRLAGAMAPAAAARVGNPTSLIKRGNFPERVHVVEDYETDIEKRWWLSGKLETANLPPPSSRACRGVLTQDFDDRMGKQQTMYTAVVFNPVPGPPMGKNPRLAFRYWLKGTDTLRVQIYSLSKGYHPYLSVNGLSQGQWAEGAVDMTAARRPDGSGGPLSENERIDDIQFYVDAAAELLIDDIVLYDASLPQEKRPFPKRILFSGWFDTGKQGQEWPGRFDILPKKGYFWHAARSVPHPVQGVPWIRLDLRGQRPLGPKTQLFFRYHLSGTDRLKVTLVNATRKETHEVEVKGLQRGRWAETTVDFSAPTPGKPAGPRQGDRVREILLWLPAGAELLLDDLLLYEPG